MKNTEQFDEWIRGEMGSLNSPPENFQSSAVWQKLQTELHPVPAKKTFFVIATVRRAKASAYRIAAAVVLLLMLGGIWWKTQEIPTQIAVNQSKNQLQNSPILPKKQILPAVKNDILIEEVTLRKQIALKKQSKEKLPELNSAKAQNFDKVEIPIEASTEIETVADVSATEQSANPVISKTTTKPKFKIVHANELADYQKAELAEVREKEAKARGFVVINWNVSSTNQSTNSLLTYFKNKSSKAD